MTSAHKYPFQSKKNRADDACSMTNEKVINRRVLNNQLTLRACLYGGGGPQVGEITRLPLFYFDHVYMTGGVTRLGRLPGLPGRVTLSAGVTICHVNVSRWGNPPSLGRVYAKKLKSETYTF